MQSHRTAQRVACHSPFNSVCKSQKNIYNYSLHSKAFESIITTWKSHMCSLLDVLSQSPESSDWFKGFAVWSVAEVRHLSCLMPALQMSCLVWLYKQYHAVFAALCMVWLHEIADWGAETAPVVFLVKTSITLSILTSCKRVLSWLLWAFLVCFWSASKHTCNH